MWKQVQAHQLWQGQGQDSTRPASLHDADTTSAGVHKPAHLHLKGDVPGVRPKVGTWKGACFTVVQQA